MATRRKSILTERLNFERSFWKGISTEAKDFVQQLLERSAPVTKRARLTSSAPSGPPAPSLGTATVPCPNMFSPSLRLFLTRDVAKRPTAKEALKHCWFKATLEGAGAEAAAAGGADAPVPLHSDVVQRLQRFGQSSLFKRSVLQMIAQEIIPLIQVQRRIAIPRAALGTCFWSPW